MKHYRPLGNHEAPRADRLEQWPPAVPVLTEAEEAKLYGYRLPLQLPEFRKLMAFQDLHRKLPITGQLQAHKVHRQVREAYDLLGSPTVAELVSHVLLEGR